MKSVKNLQNIIFEGEKLNNTDNLGFVYLVNVFPTCFLFLIKMFPVHLPF